MATVYVSPGVFTQENDLSFVPAGLAQIGAAVIGRTQKGPAFTPTRVTSFSEFRQRFGNLDTNFYAPYAAKNYLQNSNILNVVRVLGTNTSVDVGQAVILAFPTEAISGTPANGSTLTGIGSSSTTALAVLRSRGSAITSAWVNGTANNFTLTIDGASAQLSCNPSDSNYVSKVLGTNPFAPNASDLLPSVYVDATFDWAYFASATISGNALAPSQWSTAVGGYAQGTTPWIVSQNINGQVYQLFRFHTLSDGDAANTDVKISINVESSQVAVSSYPQFVVSVRSFNDTDARPVVLESFTCNLNPDSSNNAYIKRVIGDRTKTFSTSVDPPELYFNGEFQNMSKYIRVEVQDGYPVNAKPSGFQGISCMNFSSTQGAYFPSPWKFTHLNGAGNLDPKVYMGFNSDNTGAANRLGFRVTSISAGSGSAITDGLLIHTLTAEANNSGTATLANSYFQIDCSRGAAGSVTAGNSYNKIAFAVPFFGGFDGLDVRDDEIQSHWDGTLSADFFNAIKVLGNPDEIDFNLLCVPGAGCFGAPASNGNIASKATDMVTTRGDAFFIADVTDSTQTTVTASLLNSTVAQVVSSIQPIDSNYSAVYYPAVRILDTDNNKFLWVPSSVAVFGAYAFNDKVAQPWFAPAGLNRGVLNVYEARKRLTQSDRDSLYLGRVNPIATFSGQGIVIWGQKTLQFRASALDRVNVRRLLIVARKTIASVAKFFAFEPNNGLTRSKLSNAINPILANIQRNQGLEQFKVVIDDSNNTPDIIDRNILVGDIYLQPTRTAEILIFNFNITRSGVTFGE